MDKVSSSSEKGFDSKLLDNESYLKTKLKKVKSAKILMTIKHRNEVHIAFVYQKY